jgi:ABC-type branched-subunit amino acid transport system substrate-binding protein
VDRHILGRALMTRWNRNARTPLASGLFLFVGLAFGIACSGTPSGEIEPQLRSFPDPVLAPGPTSPGEQARATELFAQAADANDSGRYAQAVSLAQRIVDQYPSSSVSGRALGLLARSAYSGGEYVRADSAGGRFADLLTPDDPRRGELRLLQASALAALSEPAASLRRLLQIEPSAATNTVLRGLDLAREVSAAIEDPDEMEAILDETPIERPLRPVALTRHAAILYEIGEDEASLGVAVAAIEAGARGADSLIAQGIIDGNPLGLRRRLLVVHLGSVLPLEGSPILRDFARRVAEGVEVAAATYLGSQAQVELDQRDDEGDPASTAELIRELEETGALGAVGFLEEASLDSAAMARTRSLPLISPTARTAPEEGVYSLAGADPRAAMDMARYAAFAGYARVAIVHSTAPASTEEADVFEESLSGLGVPLAGRFPYPAGATFFGDQIRSAQNALRAEEILALGLTEEDTLDVSLLDPVAVFIPVPPEDVELLAPQVTFYGLDTLAIQVLGTSGWTDPQALETVDTRHTTGVVATAPVGAGPGSEGYRRFREAYESHFQRSLVSPVPALGYDAALLLLEAAREGPRTPQQMRRALENVREVEGATGIFSVEGGRVVRRTEVVRIEHGTLIPIG